MANRSFDTQKAALEEACEVLRVFTLARRGAGPQYGVRAIARVNALCGRIRTRFATGPDAGKAASLLASVRGRVLAAEARLALLTRKSPA